MDPGSKRARWGGRGAGAALPVGRAGLYRALGWEMAQTSMGAVVVAVCHRVHDQEENEAFFRRLGEASCSQAHILMGNFNILDICQKGITRGHMRSILEFRVATGNLEQLAW